MPEPIPFVLPGKPSLTEADTAARLRALDPQCSFLVEAPAGSGKTALLVQRFLGQLLDPQLEAPEEVLAITFTRKATAELRERIVRELNRAADELPAAAAPYERITRELARQVMERSRQQGWDLTQRTARLNIRSIDSVCSAIASAVPVLSGAGGPRNLLPDARPLYRMAARRTLFALGGSDQPLHDALRKVLLHRDANLADTERLLASMLSAREQWGELIPLDPELLTGERLDAEVRPHLEATLERIVCSGLARARSLMPPHILAELAAMAHRHSGEPGYKDEPNPFAFCRELPGAPGDRAEEMQHWRALIHFLLKKDGGWRSSFAVNHLGFALPRVNQNDLKEHIAAMESEPLREALVAVRALPPAKYPEAQWQVIKALFHVLRRALAELKLVFAERGECDFAEMSLAARQALEAEPATGNLALTGGGLLRHLLVDEMQDTSAAQYDLLEGLTLTWDGRTQTLFLVGDPKQSIYQFRQARVERFLRAMREAKLGDVPLEPLQLSLNFRSQEELVQEINSTFEKIFPNAAELASHSSDVPFVPVAAARPQTFPQALQWHVTVHEGAPDLPHYRRQEAQEIRERIEEWLTRPLPPDRTEPKKPWKLVVLARTRTHLADVAVELRRAAIPFRAVDVEVLSERQEVLDCLALVRALLHPADRIAWLSVLHAPWCGLALADLLALTGEGPDASPEATVAELVETRRNLLSHEGQQLLECAWPVLRTAVGTLGTSLLSVHAERTWRSLGGDLTLEADARHNAERFFRLVQEVESLDSGRLDLSVLEAKLAELYAEPTTLDPAQPSVELMTIHRAKGLEWDVVFVPGLERPPRSDSSELLNWIELDGGDRPDAGSEILLAPISSRGEAATELNAWLRSARAARDRFERKRVFYVACTRAREELHLFAARKRKQNGELAEPARGSLLDACLPAAEEFFAPASSAAIVEMPVLLNEAEEPIGLALAASGDAPHRPPPLIHRLPLSVEPRTLLQQAPAAVPPTTATAHLPRLDRPEGSFGARAFGNVMHRYLELLANALAAGQTPEALRTSLAGWLPRLTASLRGEGIPPDAATSEARRVLDALTRTLHDPAALWILTPHPEASSESALVHRGATRRADRSFLAGHAPLSTGDTHVWIIDFKTTEKGSRSDQLFREQEMGKYRSQLESYAQLRRSLAGETRPIRLALFYPLDGTFLEWKSEPTFGL